MGSYGPKAKQTIEKTMQEFSAGRLKIESSGARVTSRQQALAIGISKAQAVQQKTPNKKGNSHNDSHKV